MRCLIVLFVILTASAAQAQIFPSAPASSFNLKNYGPHADDDGSSLKGKDLNDAQCEVFAALARSIAEDRDNGVPEAREITVMRFATAGMKLDKLDQPLSDMIHAVYKVNLLTPERIQILALTVCNIRSQMRSEGVNEI